MLDRLEISRQYDRFFNTKEWVVMLPIIKFPDNFLVKIIPPYGGASIRFRVMITGSEKIVSVYLDCYESLGSAEDSRPYWEAYLLNSEEEPLRYSLYDTFCLIEGIKSLLEEK